MKKYVLILLFLITIAAEAAIVFSIGNGISEVEQDTVAINRCVKAIETNFGQEEAYPKELSYAILDDEGTLVYQNREDVSTTLNEAIKKNDTILDLNAGGRSYKIILANPVREQIETLQRNIVVCILVISGIQIILLILYIVYLYRTVIAPFDRMKDFAVRVAGGNLDLPLTMDRGHIFGGFTESFDLMRSELKKARIAEKKAYDDKNELVAKLSHDIKTPVASIKSTSEIGYELSRDEKTKELFNTVNFKSDQITTLVDNLFNSSINEITEISVEPSGQPSEVITTAIKNADYMKKAGRFTIPDCRVYVDKLRLQQAFDNIFMNSYKYAGTPITVSAEKDDEYLRVTVADTGDGVKKEELPLLKEKYWRGSNITGRDGAGLGLYLTDYFLNSMDGCMELASKDGFSVTFCIRIL
ncbi:MAG: HAMP domain-containing histidine kinase [Eubacterium sp.]|nr:HAMP domain-containing histidine kinase [Eubacterium sp.]